MDSALKPLNPLEIPKLLRSLALHPKKGLGQNFLVDETALARITHAAEIPPDAEVLEIGPGLGSLTRHLANAAKRVVAVELDAALIPALQQVIAPWSNVEVIQADILKLDPARLLHAPGYLVVANIPYYITSAVIRHLLEATIQPARMVLTVQLEVAQRICAGPGEMSLLALSVQVYGAPRIAARIPAGAFYPPPKIDSAAVRMDLFPEPVVPAPALDSFFRLAKAGFSQKRKTLRNSLSGGLGWNAARAENFLRSVAIDPTRRAETLSLDEWKQLALAYLAEANPS